MRVVLDEFLAHPAVSIAPIGQETAQRYAVVLASLRRRGQPLPTNDVWIAATTLDVGGVLLTSDAHFGLVDGLDALVVGTA